jgi:hypothetical protein
VKAISDGATKVREVLGAFEVSKSRIQEAVERYQKEASSRSSFSFYVDTEHTIKISGTGRGMNHATIAKSAPGRDRK